MFPVRSSEVIKQNIENCMKIESMKLRNIIAGGSIRA